jgi:hypothetical protein
MVYWLVLIVMANGPAITVVPVPYQTLEACVSAGDEYVGNTHTRSYECSPMPTIGNY